jgi:TetR/AcrR family transcriptional regulator, transcriptional repressor of bet genes
MPKITDTEATKTRIVRAAWKVIATEGIEAATLRRVATEAGCTTGLITHYFSDKNELVTHAYRKVLDRMIADATEQTQRDGTIVEKLLAAIEVIEPTQPEVKEFTIVLINFWAAAAFNSTFAKHCREDYKRWRALISAVIRAGIKAGEIRADADVKTLTDILTLISDGLSVGMTLTPTAYPAIHRRAIITQMLQPYLQL